MSTPPPKPMVIAFDYGATLRKSDGAASLRYLATAFMAMGIRLICISAIKGPPGKHDELIRREIEDLANDAGTPIRFDAIRFVYYPDSPTDDDMWAAGKAKAAVMQEHGATILIDDSLMVCYGAKAGGALVVHHTAGVFQQVLRPHS